MKKIFLIITLALYLTSCGVKGGLYLPADDSTEKTTKQ
jgi:predicted small lipoprotein YifL